jgi:hypothetical protein
MATVILGETAVTITDFTGKKGVTKINMIPLSAANFDSVTVLIDAYVTALGALTDGALNHRTSGNVINTVPPGAPGSTANRSARIASTYVDTATGRSYTTVISSRKDSAVPQVAGQPNINIGAAPYSAYVTAFNNLAVSVAGNTVAITKARWVGRN